MKRLNVVVALSFAVVAAVGSGYCTYLIGSPEWAPWLVLFVSYSFWALGFLTVADVVNPAPLPPEGFDDGSGRRPVWTSDQIALLSPYSAWRTGLSADDMDVTAETDLRVVLSHRAPRPRRAGVR